MKRIISLVLAVIMVLSFSACKGSDEQKSPESTYSDPTYFDGKTTAKVEKGPALEALSAGKMELQTEEDGDYTSVTLGMTSEEFVPLFKEGEFQPAEHDGFYEYLPVGGQIFVSAENSSDGACAIAQYGDVFGFSPTITTKEQIRNVMGEPTFEGMYSDASSSNLIYGTANASCLMYQADGNELWFIFTSSDVFQSTVMCRSGKFIFNI